MINVVLAPDIHPDDGSGYLVVDMFDTSLRRILDDDNVWHEPIKEFIQQRVRFVLSLTDSPYILHETNISFFIAATNLKLHQTKYYFIDNIRNNYFT
jgi:hypothetical protein